MFGNALSVTNGQDSVFSCVQKASGNSSQNCLDCRSLIIHNIEEMSFAEARTHGNIKKLTLLIFFSYEILSHKDVQGSFYFFLSR